MNKIIIVGHPNSGFEEVQRLLAECGMSSALRSRRENLTPTEITQTLVKAHGVKSVEQLQSAQQLPQIKVAPVWQGMALDLMLANLEQPLWGWADTEAVYLLDYWKEQDPQIVFVLVYDTPETVFTRARLDEVPAAPEELRRRLDTWTAYNAALLHFHLRSAGRSVLVHAGQVQASARSSLHQISAHINTPLQLSPGLLASDMASNIGHQDDFVESDSMESLMAKLKSMQGRQFRKARKRLRAQLEAMQPPDVVEHLPAPALELSYSEPEAHETTQHETTQLGTDALTGLLAQQLLQSYPHATQLYEELQAAATLAHGADVQPLLALQSENSLAAWQAWQILLQQRRHLQEQAHRTKAQAVQIKLLQQQMGEATRLEQEKQECLQVQLLQVRESLHQQQQIAQELKQAAEQENRLLLAQLHQVQEEFERHALESKKRNQNIEQLANSEALSAVRQKLVEQNSVKVELEKMLIAQKSQADLLQKQLKIEIQTVEGLKKDLLLAKKQSMADNGGQKMDELLLVQLHQVQEELESYYQDNKSPLKVTQQKTAILYGAAQRVRQQLPYRLGAVMIKQSKSLGGWFGLPVALLRENRRYKTELNQLEAEKLPPISSYHDAYEAEGVRSHLSFRLGEVFLANLRSPIGWLCMPWALGREVRDFRKHS